VGIAGVPASGKSTFAQMLLKALCKYSTVSAILVGLDGWHYSRSELDAMPNPQLAHDRRGAHWTFDAESYVEFVRALRQDITEDSGVLTAPGFDHANKDPTPGAVCIEPEHRIVIIEGLYTLLSIAPWTEASSLLDERWLIRVDAIKARERLIERHVMTRVAKDRQEAIWRADENDGPSLCSLTFFFT